MKQNIILTIIISLFCLSPINGEGFVREVLVKTTDKSIAIHELVKHQKLLSYDFKSANIVQSHICFAYQKHVDCYYKITVADESIICAPDQKFFCVNHHEWIAADQLMVGDALLSHSGFVLIDAIELIREPKDLYVIGLSPPHNFFVGRHEICAHNLVPIAIVLGLSAPSVVGGAVASSTLAFKAAVGVAGAFVGAISLLFAKKSRLKHAKDTNYRVTSSASGGGGYDPNDPKNQKDRIIRVNNMHEFFETEFGKEIRPHLEKTKKSSQGQSVYRVTRDMPQYGLHKGDQLYLDALHKDHLEVFDKCGKSQVVLNLDGTVNNAKMDAARLRRI